MFQFKQSCSINFLCTCQVIITSYKLLLHIMAIIISIVQALHMACKPLGMALVLVNRVIIWLVNLI